MTFTIAYVHGDAWTYVDVTIPLNEATERGVDAEHPHQELVVRLYRLGKDGVPRHTGECTLIRALRPLTTEEALGLWRSIPAAEQARRDELLQAGK